MRGTAARRIAVLGCSGSGKSTLAAIIARTLRLPYVATDQVYWRDDWRPTPDAEVRAWLESAVAEPAWVTDGNFDNHRDLLWARADLIVWLDLPLTPVLAQVLRRNLVWWVQGTRVWGGQRMTWAKALSGVQHTLRSHGLKQRNYPGWLADCEPRAVVRLRSRSEVSRWVGALSIDA